MRYDLVFEGGGAKGMAFVGALGAFEAAGHSFGRVVGSSAGAITATVLAAGYDAAEMRDALSEKAGDRPVFATFLGDPPAPADPATSATAEFLHEVDLSFVPQWAEGRLEKKLLDALADSAAGRHLLSFFEYGGFYAADAFVVWLERKLSEGRRADGRPRDYGRMTLAEFHRATRVDLSLTASDVTNGRLRILNHRTAPDVPVVWAARMSMSVPLLWQEVVWREAWGGYRGFVDAPPVSLTGAVMVDGGLLSNFPIELLVSREERVRRIMGPDAAEGVMGFLIDEGLPVEGAPPPPAGRAVPGLGTLGSSRTAARLKGLMDTVLQARDKMVIDENRGRVARLPAKSYGTTEFGMSDARREALIAAAAAATAAHLRQAVASGLESLEALSTAESDRIALGMLGVE